MTLRNDGALPGGEVVQLYVKAEREGTPNPQLKAFHKIHLLPQESKDITVHLPVTAFALYDEEGKRRLYKSDYTVYVGTSQPDERSRLLTGKRAAEIKLVSELELEI
ncbi:Thermostable beta-glucosidase B [compost metagenome]